METQLHRVRAPAAVNPDPRRKREDNHGSDNSPQAQEQSAPPQEEEYSVLILYNSQGQIVKKY